MYNRSEFDDLRRRVAVDHELSVVKHDRHLDDPEYHATCENATCNWGTKSRTGLWMVQESHRLHLDRIVFAVMNVPSPEDALVTT